MGCEAMKAVDQVIDASFPVKGNDYVRLFLPPRQCVGIVRNGLFVQLSKLERQANLGDIQVKYTGHCLLGVKVLE